MTEEEAINLYNSKWWENKTDEEVALFQLNEPLLCMPFHVFHNAVEKWLGRPVWSHEFARPDLLLAEKSGKRITSGHPLETFNDILKEKS